jgi:phage terminase large subunit-like protein
LQLGKGSGKDHTSTVACAYIVYKLLCLKDPARYFGKPPGDAIDIINVAINAEQAKNVFFKGFKTKIEKSPWFAGKYDPKVNSIGFDKSITVYSGHSERESHEGLNLFMAVLDEISGFATEVGTGNDQGKTADNIYKAFRGTVDSRFPDLGKVVLLSFPRYNGDFISKRYEDVIMEKDVIERRHKFIINEELPEGPDNEFEIVWEEDHIKSYKYPRMFALKRPTWEVNPTRKIEDFKIAFLTDQGDAMMRFLCTPTYSSDAFFKQKDKLERCMTLRNPLDNYRRFDPIFKPDPDKIYYVHADLAQKHDKCAVAIAHVDKWVNIQVIKDYEQVAPIVIVDAVAWWEPKVEGPVDLSEVKRWIQNLRREGFNIGSVTFDRWQSFDIQQELKAVGIKTDTVSVAKKHYEDLAMMVYEERIAMPMIPLLLDELSELKIMRGNRVDHPRKKSKDLADAVCGAVFGAISNTHKESNMEIEVHTWSSSRIDRQKADMVKLDNKPIPDDVRDYLDKFDLL